MVDTNFSALIFTLILTILLTFYPKSRSLHEDETLTDVSEFVLVRYWERGRTDICNYGLWTFVYKGGFLVATSNRNMKLYKSMSKLKIPHQNSTSKALTLHIILLLCGDIATNTGPIKYPCGQCGKPVRSNQYALHCDGCDTWYMSRDVQRRVQVLQIGGIRWLLVLSKLCSSKFHWLIFQSKWFHCQWKLLYILSKDGSSTSSLHDTTCATPDNSTTEDACDIFKTLSELKKRDLKKPNNLRYKFNDIKRILTDRLCDILNISEMKLDDSFNDNLFLINGYKIKRKDRNVKGGGLIVYKSDLSISESIFLEMRLKNRTWGLSCNYRPPSLSDALSDTDFSSKLDQIFIKYDYVFVIGDLNYQILVSEKCLTLKLINPFWWMWWMSMPPGNRSILRGTLHLSWMVNWGELYIKMDAIKQIQIV